MSRKVAIVTGSSSGIGRETAILFARNGINVVVTSRTADAVNRVVNECNRVASNNAEAIGVICDVNNDVDRNRLVNSTIEKFGRIDILVNNAGAAVPRSSISDTDLGEKYDLVMDTNVKAPMMLCNLAVPHLVKSKGCIVNVGSCLGLKPTANTSIYCTSKAALNMLTKCLAIELGPQGVRVNCVNPSYISETDIFRNQMNYNDEMVARRDQECREKYPLRRPGLPIDVAKAIAFLASDDSSFTTGECMLVDGGALFGMTYGGK